MRLHKNHSIPVLAQIFFIVSLIACAVPAYALTPNQVAKPQLMVSSLNVANYPTNTGLLRGYAVNLVLPNGTFAGARSIVVKLFSGDALLQTNRSTGSLNVNATGSALVVPLDVSGTFDYFTEGNWTNTKEAEYGQSTQPTRATAIVTLANGTTYSAESNMLTGDPTIVFSSAATEPRIIQKSECRNRGWRNFTELSFATQRQCEHYVEEQEAL